MKTPRHLVNLALFMILALAIDARAADQATPTGAVLLETEQFDEHGGWVLDSQFIDQMGSTFLLAHGLGEPVADAKTSVALRSAGQYRVWVRTRDWTAPWQGKYGVHYKPEDAPGRFQVLVDGEPLPSTFGASGSEWHWQDGGTVTLQGQAAIALHDLTGFDGRCDAILLVPTSTGTWTPPADTDTIARMRRQLLGHASTAGEGGDYDLVVVGGGIAGICAAVSAARLGLDVALIQDRPVLGGNNSSEVRVWLHGARNLPPYPRVGDVVLELEQARRAHYGPSNTAELYEDDRKLAVVKAEKKLDLFLGHRVVEAQCEAERIQTVTAVRTRTGEKVRFRGSFFADCTGDGCVGYLAGADFTINTNEHMGRCNLWNVKDTGEPVAFPKCPWTMDLAGKPFPGDDGRSVNQLGGWYWESGFNHDPFEKSEYIRDWNFLAAYGAWDELKNNREAYPNHQLNWVAHVSGRRESRLLSGDVILNAQHLLDGTRFDDGCVPTGWSMDVHVPNEQYVKGFEGDAFIAKAVHARYKTPFWIPYRCLYSRNVSNLFMAGRDVSVTHQALGTVRVMRTGGCMGEIVGMAASLCREHGTGPRGVYEKHLQELKALMTKGVGRPPLARAGGTAAGSESGLYRLLPKPPAWLAKAGTNLAPTAEVAVTGRYDPKQYPPENVNDGRIDCSSNEPRFVGASKMPDTVELHWDQPQTIGAVRIVSGMQGPKEPNTDFVLQRHDGTDWVDVPETKTKGNVQIDWGVTFDPITTDRLRLQVTRSPYDRIRIWEWEVYPPIEK